MSLYTVGHSTLEWPEFLRLIEPVELLVDVRSHPTSRWPQYNRDSMAAELGDRYEWWPGLGGWSERHLPLAGQFPWIDIQAYGGGKFPKQRIAAQAPSDPDGPAWTNQGLLDYAYFMGTQEFIEQADRLLSLSDPIDIGILCCEVLPWRCHRSMIADYATWRCSAAYHLQPKLQKHTDHIGNRLQRYPDMVRLAWREWEL